MGILSPQRTPRPQIDATAQGFLSDTYPLGANGGSVALAAQTMRVTLLGLRQGDVVTNIILAVNVAAAGTAGVVNVGLYDSSLNRVALSGDVNASLTAIGLKSCALTSPYTVTADGAFYAAVLMTTAYGTTQPSLVSNNATGASGSLAGKPKMNGSQGGQSSLPVTASLSDTGVIVWFAVN